MKKWSVLLTAVTATLASIQSTFHIRENIETFIKTSTDLISLETDYLVERAPFDNELKKSGGKNLDPELQKKLVELRQKFVPRYLNIETSVMRAWANAGQQSTGSQSANGGSDKK